MRNFKIDDVSILGTEAFHDFDERGHCRACALIGWARVARDRAEGSDTLILAPRQPINLHVVRAGAFLRPTAYGGAATG